ncbi:kinase-like domain-containing protein [Rhizophagus irregularis DAOM 181602=DAOM 197198]|nr:kinase-like domain-containing protein [Rhizophagus irregularis DAOM 181602=DAOM 197198]
MHRRLDFCPRIIRVLGISFDSSVQEYWQTTFFKINLDDKIRLSYQITERIKFFREKKFFSDIYSSGVLMRKLSGGKPPFVDNESVNHQII